MFVAGMAHDFQVFSQLIGYSPAEIDNPFFYKVFQLAPGGGGGGGGGGGFARKFCPGGWWNSP